MLICFIGIDGSGKTLQAQRLVKRLNSNGFSATYAWAGRRSYVGRPFVALGKRLLGAPRIQKAKTGLQAGKAGSISQATQSQYLSYLSSTRRIFKLPFVLTIWRYIGLIESVARIRYIVLPALMNGQIVVCDRYIYDTIVGLAVLCGYDQTKALKLLPRSLYNRIPSPDKCFFLDVPPAVGYSRRNDVVDVEYLKRRSPLYQATAAAYGMQVIDGSSSIDEIEETVWKNVQPLLKRDKPAMTDPQNVSPASATT